MTIESLTWNDIELLNAYEWIDDATKLAIEVAIKSWNIDAITDETMKRAIDILVFAKFFLEKLNWEELTFEKFEKMNLSLDQLVWRLDSRMDLRLLYAKEWRSLLFKKSYTMKPLAKEIFRRVGYQWV